MMMLKNHWWDLLKRKIGKINAERFWRMKAR